MNDPTLDSPTLGDWLEAGVAGFTGSFTISKFASGQSNPTYRIDCPASSFVLRRKPLGPVLSSAHAVDREYALLSALAPTGFPVPRPLALCTDPELIGSIFYVMECVDGTAYFDGSLPGMTPARRTRIYEALVDTLARLHSIDPAAVGLAEFGKPGNYFARQIVRWTRQYRDSQTDDLPEMERLIEFLPRAVPEQTRSSIVHGDYRIDNVLFDAGDELTAVLDWELSTLGDPLADFSYFAMQWALPADGTAALEGLDLDRLGIPTLDAITARYCAATRREDLPKLDWYFAYNLFRLAGIVQGIKKRVIDGTASSAKAAEIAKRVPQLAQSAWYFAQRSQALGGSPAA